VTPKLDGLNTGPKGHEFCGLKAAQGPDHSAVNGRESNLEIPEGLYKRRAKLNAWGRFSRRVRAWPVVIFGRTRFTSAQSLGGALMDRSFGGRSLQIGGYDGPTKVDLSFRWRMVLP